MNPLPANEVRKRYLEFFASHGHKVMSSDSLVPANDPTLIWNGFLARVPAPIPGLREGTLTFRFSHPVGRRAGVGTPRCAKPSPAVGARDDPHASMSRGIDAKRASTAWRSGWCSARCSVGSSRRMRRATWRAWASGLRSRASRAYRRSVGPA